VNGQLHAAATSNPKKKKMGDGWVPVQECFDKEIVTVSSELVQYFTNGVDNFFILKDTDK
jgi:hypothetical protein